jgi:hypothetical protein
MPAHTTTPSPLDQFPQQPQRQDALDDQLDDLERVAVRLGLYDAHDWLRARRTRT